MKYALLIYGDQSDWETLSDEERARRRAESMPGWLSLFDELQKADANVSGHELEESRTAKVVRVRDGERIVTDGPFAETKEQLGGYFLVDCDLETALDYAARIPAADHGAVEVRQIAEGPT